MLYSLVRSRSRCFSAEMKVINNGDGEGRYRID